MGMEDIVNERLNPTHDGNIYAYKFIKFIGKGAFGEVWKVSRDGKFYALKAPLGVNIQPGYLPQMDSRKLSEDDRKTLRKEALTWARLTDLCPDAVVCLLDFNVDPFPWMLMDLAEEDLFDAIDAGRANIRDFCQLLIKLQKIHELGIIHRDIKPRNILKVNGEWKFSDFGLSKIVSKVTTGNPCGSLLYMAPEQAFPKELGYTSNKTDLWEMGIMLMYDFLKIDPYPSANTKEELLAHIITIGPDLSSIPNKYYPALQGVFVKNQSVRFNDCLDFLNHMPWCVIPDNLDQSFDSMGIHPVDNGNYDQYYYFNEKTQTILIGGKCCKNPVDLSRLSIKKAVFLNGVETIDTRLLNHCNSLIQISIPSSVCSIDNAAFYGCKLLKKVDIDESNDHYCVYNDCIYSKDRKTLVRVLQSTSVKSFIIPDGVEAIQGGAFFGCTSIESIYIPASLSSIGKYTFDYCTNLKRIDVDSSNMEYCSVDGCLYNKLKTDLIRVPESFSYTKYKVLDSVITIQDGAFFNCYKLKSIDLPSNVSYIGYHSFEYCSSLQEISLPNSVIDLKKGAFKQCKSLKYIHLPPHLLGKAPLFFDSSKLELIEGYTSSVLDQLFNPDVWCEAA